MITSGTQQGLHLASQVLLGAGDQAWVENPAYRGITALLDSTGRRDAMVWCRSTPTVSTSTPASVSRRMRGSRSSRRRTSIRSACRSAWRGAMRCSPGHVGNARGWSRTITTASCATKAIRSRRCKADPDRVIYLGTFSKILFPSLRLGYVIAPDDLVPAFCGARVLMDRHVPTADQHVLAAFIAEGHLDRHIRRVRGVYAEQRTLLIDTLGARLPRERAWVQPGDQGMHVVLWLAEGIDDLDVVERAARRRRGARGVADVRARYRPPGPRAGFGGFGRAQMEAAAQPRGGGRNGRRRRRATLTRRLSSAGGLARFVRRIAPVPRRKGCRRATNVIVCKSCKQTAVLAGVAHVPFARIAPLPSALLPP